MDTQTKHIENVFDPEHHITDKEWEAISLISKEDYLSFLDEGSANIKLADLYGMRGDLKLMYKYLDRLPYLVKLERLHNLQTRLNLNGSSKWQDM